MKLYLIGSLRNPRVPLLAEQLRALLPQWQVFDDWYAAGPEADDKWMEYEKARGRDFIQALDGHACNHVFDYDRHHLKNADAVCLVLPAGKSGHLEFGYCVGRGTPSFILLDGEPERFDAMYRFATEVVKTPEALVEVIKVHVDDEKF
jgi:nucleoside 2-deoxyribosyltransferase